MNKIFFLIDFSLSLFVALLLLFGSFLSVQREEDREKLSSYECGFDPFLLPAAKFDVRFYLVALLFIIFDLELVYILPWCISVDELGLFGLVSMYIFLFILTLGFVYEWLNGGLEWADPVPNLSV